MQEDIQTGIITDINQLKGRLEGIADRLSTSRDAGNQDQAQALKQLDQANQCLFDASQALCQVSSDTQMHSLETLAEPLPETPVPAEPAEPGEPEADADEDEPEQASHGLLPAFLRRDK